MPIDVFSFFSGLGFLDLGFENAGFNIAFVNEYNETFLRAYQYARRHRDFTPEFGYSHDDVRAFLSDEKWEDTFPQYDHRGDRLIGFIGGPPCPDFSAAGTNAGEKGLNGQLTTVYVQLIEKRRPDFFVLENVKGLYQTKKHHEYYERIKRRLYRSGYSLFDSIENALLYGVPQFRDRLILIGFKRERFGRNLQYVFGGRRLYTMDIIKRTQWPTVTPFQQNGRLEQPRGIIQELTVQHWFEINRVEEHPNACDCFAVKMEDKFLTIPEGESRGKSFKRLHRWRYSPTAAYGNNEVHLHPYLPRRISVAEALAIQSLPQDFSLPSDITLSSKFKMVGNGVPYLLALGIARDLYEWIENNLRRIEGENG